jgi:hypothetical protein
MEINRKDRKEYKKEYYKKNKEKFKENNKEYREKNKEKIKEWNKEYFKEYYKTDVHKKCYTINTWKRRGVIHNNFDELYKTYINTTNCDVCFKEFKNSYDRTLDHDHETGEFRMILCRACNTLDSFKKKIFI